MSGADHPDIDTYEPSDREAEIMEKYGHAFQRLVEAGDIGSERWLRERFPDKDWHCHPRTDGVDLCDGTPSDCASKERS